MSSMPERSCLLPDGARVKHMPIERKFGEASPIPLREPSQPCGSSEN